MNSNYKKPFSELLALSAEIYGKELTLGIVQLFWELLSDYDFAQVEKAFKTHMSQGKFFPVPADIIALMPEQKKIILRNGNFYALRDGREVRIFNPSREQVNIAVSVKGVGYDK